MKCNLLVVDVAYDDDNNLAYIVGAASSNNERDIKIFTMEMENIEPYVSGEFYKREMPCIEKLIDKHNLEPDILIVDAFCQFKERDCLGGIFHSKHNHIKVIGVAKNAHRDMPDNCELIRGLRSSKPLYVTSSGISIDDAKMIIRNLKGDARMPFLLKMVDSLTKKKTPSEGLVTKHLADSKPALTCDEGETQLDRVLVRLKNDSAIY